MQFSSIQKAFSASDRVSTYIFSCPHRAFPVVVSYPCLSLLAEISHASVQSLLAERNPRFFDSIPCGCRDDKIMGQMARRGFTVSKIATLTDIHPIELALYFSGLADMDEVTMEIILKHTHNLDLPFDPLPCYRGEAIADLM